MQDLPMSCTAKKDFIEFSLIFKVLSVCRIWGFHNNGYEGTIYSGMQRRAVR
jgi:hypothetical protein